MQKRIQPGNILFACLGLAVLTALLYGPVVAAAAAARAPGFAPNDACVGNLRLLNTAIQQYAQLNDERLPATDTPAHFQAALRPYVDSPARFLCPDTGLPYTPNPAISGRSLTQFPDPEAVEVARDSRPHADGKNTVLFLDGRVERGGAEQGDPNKIITARAKAVALGVIQYTQDNDELYPPMHTAQEFQEAVYPYVRSHRAFVSPASGQPFLPNPALSGVSLASLGSPATTVLFQDQAPYTGGQPLIAYADGHITHGPASPPSSQADVSNLKQISLGALQYTQDNDEFLPTTTDYAAFQSQISPYVRNPSAFVSPMTGLPYQLNPAVSGAFLDNIADPASTELIRDAQINPDGTWNVGYVDGHVRQTLFFVPRMLALAPDNGTALLWPKARDAAALWTLTPNGGIEDKQTYPVAGTALGISVGGDGLTRLLSVAANGVVTLQTLSGTGGISSRQFGPYDGWTPLSLASGADGDARLLWQRYDGKMALWTISPDGSYRSDLRLPALSGRTPVGIARSLSGGTFLLLRAESGAATLWTLSPEGQTLRLSSARSRPGFRAVALAAGADGKPRILWDGESGQAQVWTYSASGTPQAVQPVTLTAGGQAVSLAVGAAGDSRILWTRPGGAATLQHLTAEGAQISAVELMSYQ